jgi:hypothetical protein
MSEDVNSMAPAESDALASDEPNAQRSRRAMLINIARWVLLTLVIAAAVWQLAVNWTAVVHTVGALKWQRTTLSFLFVLAGVACGTMSWQVLVDGLGIPIGIGRGAQVYLVGQLGKYLPGSVWAYVLQIELGRKAGLARARVFAATVFSVVVAVVAALLCGALAVPQLVAENSSLSWLPWLYIVLPFALIMLYPPILTAIVRFGFKLLRRPRPDHPVTFMVVLQSLLWGLGSYVAYGIHLWLLSDTHQGITWGPLGLCVGTMALGMLAGIVGFLLPAGVGAREFVIIAALTPLVGLGEATAYAAVSRLMFIVADLFSAGSAAGVGVIARRRRGAYHGDTGLAP